jgi:DNA-binding beta-propeller fold protein YncE/ribosomal protein L30E
MATGGEVRQKGVEELEQEVTCPVCQDHFQEPKILPCLHYYCKGCIEALAKRAGGPNQPFPCPECRTPTLLPQGDPDQLQTAFFINRMKEVHAKLEKVEGKVEAKCEICSGGVATAFCRQCAEFICNECTRSHQRMKTFAGHKVSTLQELKEGGAKTIIAAKSVPPPICKVHEEPAKIYCYDCKTLVCRDCVVKDHRDHEYEFVKIAAPETKKKLMEHLTPLGEIQAGIQGAVRNVEGAKAEIVVMDASMTTSIKQSFQELRDILDKREKELLAETATTVEKKMTNLTVQQKKLEMSSGTIQSLVEFVERSVENATDEELMTIHTQMMTRISEETEKQQRANTELAPVEKVDKVVSIGLARDLKKQCQENTSIESLPMNIAVENANAVHNVGQRSQLVFHLTSQDGRPVDSPSIKAVIKSKVDNSCIEAGVVCTEQGTYQMEFTPTVRGRHQLEVIMYNDKPVLREPVEIFVKIPPTMLEQPVRNIHVEGQVSFVSSSLSEEILVTAGREIVVFDRSGKKLYSISNEKLTDPQGVAVSGSSIFVVDRGSNSLLKFNKTVAGELLKSVGQRGSGKGQFNDPHGLTVVGDEVIVCDAGNTRLQVFTSDLVFVRQFGSRGTGDGQLLDPVDVIHDRSLQLYISDFINQCVQVFTMQGRYLRSLVAIGVPTGIATDGELVYIIQQSGLLHIYRLNGDKVCSFPTTTHGVDVAVDQDGFIYVCDRDNNQVIIF